MKHSIRRCLVLFIIVTLCAAMLLCGCVKKEPETVSGTDLVSASDVDEDSSPYPDTSMYFATTNLPSEYTVTMSKDSGAYGHDFMLDITCDGDAVILYTLDGSDPRESTTRMVYSDSLAIVNRARMANNFSAVDPSLFDAAHCKYYAYNQTFVWNVSAPSDDEVDKCTVVKAVALDSTGAYTEVVTNTYFVGSMINHIQGIEESCEAAGSSLAIISITIDYDDFFGYENGIYVRGKIFDEDLARKIANGDRVGGDAARDIDANYKQRGRDWEREVHIDFFESDGVTTECVLSQNCGMRVQGNYSRSDFQKGLRLYARSEYGDNNFRYPVFGESLTNDAGEVMDKFATLTLRNGGNCAFTTKYSDTFWQSLLKDTAVETQTSRPCIVYINGEYWGLYVLQEDYSDDYFEDTHGVNKDDVVLYKGDAETYAIGYKLDIGDLPEGVDDVSYYFHDLLEFFDTHDNLESDEDYAEFAKLVDIESTLDYYAVELWINNKWDWPGKNWSMWKTTTVDESNPYNDGRWRFCFYDLEFGGVSGSSDAPTNTIKEDNYKEYGMLDFDTSNPSVLVYVYLMSNAGFREQFAERILSLSETYFEREHAIAQLDKINDTYSPLYDQFFARYDDVGSRNNSVYGGYASYQCIKDFLNRRAEYIQPMLDWVYNHYSK